MKRVISIVLSVLIIFSAVLCLNCESFAIPAGGFIGPNVAYGFNYGTNTLNIWGSGPMNDYALFKGYNNIYILSPFWNDTTYYHAYIDSGVTNIGDCIFAGSNIVSVTIPRSVTAIRICAFNSCDKITDVYYEGSQEEWNQIAFERGVYPFYSSSPTIHYNNGNSHQWGEWIIQEEAVDATCTQPGKTAGKTRTCAVCLGTETVNSIEIPPLGHSYKGVVQQPTCTEEGYTTYTCSRCQLSYTGEQTSPLGHSFSKSSKYCLNGCGEVNPTYEGLYEITYNANGGTGAPANQTKENNKSIKLSTDKPVKNYTITYNANGGTVKNTSKTVSCTFKTWNTLANGGGTSYSPGSTYTENQDLSLFAQWTNPAAGTLETPTRSGYTFDGWYTSLSGGSKVSSSYTVAGNTTLYAHWTETTKPTGTISSTNNVASSQTATLTLNDNNAVAGYYWGTNSAYSSNTYTTASAGSINKTISSAGTYYLTVKDTSGNISDTVSVTYYKTTLDGNSGSVSPTSVLTKSGNSFTFPTPTRSGYTYQGWNTSNTATSGVKTLSPNSNKTYYAVWKQNEVPDTTKPTGSISSTNNVASSQTATLTLSDNKAVAGYYWGTNSDYSTNIYTTASAANITKTVSAAGTYYLTVKDSSGNVSDTVSITYYKTTLDANGGSVSPANILTQSGKTFTFPTPVKNSCKYIGWSVSNTETTGVKTLTPTSNATYYAVWEYETVGKPFQWNRDNWNFYNSSYSGGFSSSTYRSQINSTYQNVLKNNLTNSEYQWVFEGSSYYDSWLDEEWGGSCYGMSSTTLLAKAGLLPFASYQSNAGSLYQLKAPMVNGLHLPSETANVSSLITYYQMLQIKDVIQQQYRTVPQKTNKENITNLISLLDKNDTVLIGFKKSGWGGHAILAYGYEYGSYSKNGVTYQGRIKICDPNHSVSDNDNYYIYFNTSSYNWAIPAYASGGISSAKGAVFNYIGATVNEINQGGYLSSSANVLADNYVARINALEISNNRSITKVVKQNGVYANHNSAPGEIVEDYAFVLGGEDKGVVGYNLYDSQSSYKVQQEDASDLALTMEYDDCLLSGSSKAGESMIFDKKGHVEIKSEASDYSVGMAFDDDYPTDWFAIEVTGENANKVELEKVETGWVIEADNLQNVQVSANNKTNEAFTGFSTDYDRAFIYEINRTTIGVSVDTDNNGSYETKLHTTKSLSNTSISLSEANIPYDGSQKKPTVTVKDGDKVLVPNRDYTVVYTNNTNIGIATASIIGMGDYAGKQDIYFNIVCNHKMHAKVTAPTATKVGYTEYMCSICGEWKKDAKGNVIKDNFTAPTGKPAGFKCTARTAAAMKFTWTKISGVSGYQIQLLNSAGKSAGIKALTGNAYTFSKLAAGHAYKARVRFYIKAAGGKNYYGAWSTISSPTLPKATKVTSATAAKKAFTAKWGKVAGVTGYQLQYATNAKFTKATTKTIKGAAKVSLAVKSLKGGTKYFVRVRTFKTIGGKNYYSTWSGAKAVITKK